MVSVGEQFAALSGETVALAESAVGYIDPAIPLTQFRLRFDAAYRDNRPDRFAFRFDHITPYYATGLQIARDPSTPIVYLGCFALFGGIGIAFYTSHKRIWAHVASGKISLGGAAHRNLEAFSGEFEELCDALGVPRPAPRKGAQAAA